MRRLRLSPFFIIIMTVFILSSLWPLLMGKNQEKIELTKAGELLDAGQVKVAQGLWGDFTGNLAGGLLQ